MIENLKEGTDSSALLTDKKLPADTIGPDSVTLRESLALLTKNFGMTPEELEESITFGMEQAEVLRQELIQRACIKSGSEEAVNYKMFTGAFIAAAFLREYFVTTMNLELESAHEQGSK